MAHLKIGLGARADFDFLRVTVQERFKQRLCFRKITAIEDPDRMLESADDSCRSLATR